MAGPSNWVKKGYDSQVLSESDVLWTNDQFCDVGICVNDVDVEVWEKVDHCFFVQRRGVYCIS